MGCTSSVACRTIPAGETFAISNRRGAVRLVEGPSRQWRCGQFFEKLEEVVAANDEYLKITYRNGETVIQPGPARIVRHPVEHAKVECNKGIRIGDQELVVVYRPNGSNLKDTARELVRGPGIYVPKLATEWLHEFSWTGSGGPEGGQRGIEKSARKVVNGLQFTKLRTSPGKSYYDVESVRTKDNAQITVKLMIFFQIRSVETLLENSSDPFADLFNAASADVIEWCAPKKFDEFLASTEQLNILDPYVQLRTQAAKIGFEVDKVVFRGYGAPQELQRMHDSAIEKRTKMVLERETEEGEQSLADFKLTKESERAANQAKLEMNRLQHDLAMSQQKADAEQRLKQQEYAVELDRLRELKALDRNMDIGKYLTARDCPVPNVIQCGSLLTPGTADTVLPPKASTNWSW